MSTSIHRTAIVVACAVFSAAVLAHQQAAVPQSKAPSGVVSLIGCVERVPATASARDAVSPAYRLIDVQPGTGTRMPLNPDARFLLALSKTLTTPIELGKLQNQRVEVSGTIAAAPVATPAPPTKPAATPAEPVLTLTVASVKVVSTECK